MHFQRFETLNTKDENMSLTIKRKLESSPEGTQSDMSGMDTDSDGRADKPKQIGKHKLVSFNGMVDPA